MRLLVPRDQQERRFTILAGVMDPDRSVLIPARCHSLQPAEISRLVPVSVCLLLTWSFPSLIRASAEISNLCHVGSQCFINRFQNFSLISLYSQRVAGNSRGNRSRVRRLLQCFGDIWGVAELFFLLKFSILSVGFDVWI